MTHDARTPVFVTTPTGNIGSRVAARLTAEGVPFSVIVRDGSASRLDPAVRDHAAVFTGAMSDADAVTRASAGASAVFLALPPDPRAEDLAELWRSFTRAVVAAIKANGIPRVVLVSTQGAGPGRGSLMGPMYETEESLYAAVPHVRALRAGFFMENLLPYADAIRNGALPLAVPADVPLRLVATRDLGDHAAGLLGDSTWEGQEHYGLYGPDELTPVQIAETFTDVLGWDVSHVPTSAEDVLAGLLAAGMTPGAAQPTADMFAILGDADAEAPADDDPRTPVGTTSTTLREFIESHVDTAWPRPA